MREILFAIQRHISACLGFMGDWRNDSICRIDCRRTSDNWSASAGSVSGFRLRSGNCDVWAFAEGAALRIPHTRDTAPRLALLLFILVLPREDDRFWLDYILTRWRGKDISDRIANHLL